jgi:RNA polymerase-binding protein DksA
MKSSPGRKSAARTVTAVKARPAKVKTAAPASRPAASAKAPAASAVAARPRPVHPPVHSPAQKNNVAHNNNNPSARPREASGRATGRPEPLVNRPIPEAVPTDGKPRKNQAGLNMRELEHFRDLLLDKRRELVGDMSQMEREALRSSGGSNLSTLPLHMADMGTDNYEQEFTLGLVEKDRNLLREINAALAKIQNGTFGICEGTGKPISKPRLEAQPWAKYSIEYARQMERGMGIGMGR